MDIHGPNIIGSIDAHELQFQNGVPVDEISNNSSTDKDNALLTSSAIQTLVSSSGSNTDILKQSFLL